jgi:DNA-binding NarL/FixJ family response regulator
LSNGAGIAVVADAARAAATSWGVTLDEDHSARATDKQAERPFNLTAKELEVLTLLVSGQSNRRIATALGMSEKTASVHVSRILTKLAVRSRGEAVAKAYELGLARPVNTGESSSSSDHRG